MPDKEKRQDELNRLAQEIRRNVREKVRRAMEEKGLPAGQQLSDFVPVPENTAAVELEVDSLSAVDRVSRTAEEPGRQDPADSFWDLGKPKPKVYAKPDFAGHSLTVTDVAGADPESAEPVRTASAEKIMPRTEFEAKYGADTGSRSSGNSGRVVNTVDGYRSVPTSDYRRRTVKGHHTQQASRETAKKRVMNPGDSLVHSYAPGGLLIDKIDVRRWESEVEFYGRFASDAALSHAALPVNSPDTAITPEPFFSYVPQYAHMTAKQVESYRWIRENIRRGRTPSCDLPYLLLYIYEIINLPDIIPPEEGVKLLCGIWLGYRGTHPRLDSLLCEWFADYCMIHAQPMPPQLLPILREIVPKAQFKEFYLNLGEEGLAEIGRILIEVSADYDFRLSRYYQPNRDAYEEQIPKAVSAAVQGQLAGRRGVFAFDRTYKMTRDSYCGAIVSSGIKRRIDLEFRSFTRRADSRDQVTALVKYAENRLRQVLGIKAKLGADGVSAEDTAVIDAFFAPMISEKKQKRPAEDAYMPADYMKNYESEDSGFDFSAAAAIERESWVNTSRLTGDEFHESIPIPEYDPDEVPVAEGEISADSAAAETAFQESAPLLPEISLSVSPENTAEPMNEANGSDDAGIRAGLRAALDGKFRAWCRENGLYEGEIADRINTVFLDEIGDVVLEDGGSGFILIEDYREDVEQWL